MFTGSDGRYQWLVDRRNGIGRLIERCPEALLHRYLVVACFDSGPVHPNADERAAGWCLENQLAYNPRLESLSLFPYQNFDEWYVFTSPARLSSCDVFINFGRFTLRNPDESLAGLPPTWDHVGARALADEEIRQQDQFWSQLESFVAEFIHRGRRQLYLRHSQHRVVRSSRNRVPITLDTFGYPEGPSRLPVFEPLEASLSQARAGITPRDTCYTYPVDQTNLTLSIDREILRRARKAAIDRDASVNELVRRYLERLANEADSRTAAVADLREIFRTSKARIGGARWTREDLHER